MRYFKIKFLEYGEEEEIIIKSINFSEAIERVKKEMKKNAGREFLTIEELPMPFDEKIKTFFFILRKKIIRKKLNQQLFISSLKQLKSMVKAGISLKDALEEIAKSTNDKLLKEIFQYTADTMNKGGTISEAFKKYEIYVGQIAVAMFVLAEKTGDLVNILNNLINIYEKAWENKRKVKKALRYPIVALVIISLAFVGIINFVVPKFKSIFEQLHGNLPLPTKFLLFLEHAFKNYGPIILITIFLSVIIIIYLYKTNIKVKTKIDKLMLKTPIVKNVVLNATLSRFLYILSALVKAGIPLIEALKISEGIINNEIIKQKVINVINGINQGRKLAEMMKEEELVDFIAIKMIQAGEEGGNLNDMLEEAANYYEEKFQDVIDGLQASIEPILTGVIAGIVLLIALGVFLPMWNLGAVAMKNG